MSVVDELIQTASRLPPAQQEEVLRYAREIQKAIEDEDRALGEAGRRMAAKILEPEDFSWLRRKDK